MHSLRLSYLLLILTSLALPARAGTPWRQVLVVRQDVLDQTRGTLTLYEQEGNAWKQTLGPLPALLGKRGTAWGRGPFFAPPRECTVKREGDGRTPAGLFSIGTLYGYSPRPPVPTRLAYTQITRHLWAITDPGSRFYNRAVDIRTVRRDWKTAGPMARRDRLYPWLLEIAHNQDSPRDGAGTWIYLHPWLSRTTPTDGCTAVAPADFSAIIRRLNPADRPHIAVIPADAHGTSLLAQLGIHPASGNTNTTALASGSGQNKTVPARIAQTLGGLFPPTQFPVLYPADHSLTGRSR